MEAKEVKFGGKETRWKTTLWRYQVQSDKTKQILRISYDCKTKEGEILENGVCYKIRGTDKKFFTLEGACLYLNKQEENNRSWAEIIIECAAKHNVHPYSVMDSLFPLMNEELKKRYKKYTYHYLWSKRETLPWKLENPSYIYFDK